MTQFNPLASDENLPEESRRQNNAIRIAAVQCLATLPTAAFFIFLSIRTGLWQLYAITGVILLLTVMYFFSLQAARKGRVLDSVRWMLTGTTAILLVGSFLFDNMGFFTGPAIVLLAAILAYQTLPAKSAREILAVAIGLGVVAMSAELFNLEYRLQVPALTTSTPIIILLGVLAIVSLLVWTSREHLAKLWRASIRNRLTAIVAGSALIPVVLVSVVLATSTYGQVKNSLTQEAFNKLSAVQTIKANQVTTYLEERRGDMVSLSNTISTQFNEALAKMDAVNSVKRDQIVQLFNTWDADVRDVASDPGVVVGVRDLTLGLQEVGPNVVRGLYLGQASLSIAPDGSSYSRAHLEQHDFFKGYIAIHGYEDAYLIDTAGNVVYSVYKRDVYATNLLTGSYKSTNLATLYKELLMAPAGSTYIADAATFDEKYTMFIGSPIYDGGNFAGILVYQLPLTAIQAIMAERTGQGETGETYLIAEAADGRITYRSDRVTTGDGKFIVGYDLTSIATQSMRDALNGESGGALLIGTTGDAVLHAYRPLGVKGVNWAVMSRITAAEAFSPTTIGATEDFLTTYNNTYGYHDIFLIEPGGRVFYTVAHEDDFGTNILTGPYKDTNLGRLVAEVLDSKSYEFADFERYAPSGNQPAAFFAVPVLDQNNNVRLVVATQASQEQISQIMAETTGLGESGETYIIGPDLLRRTETRFLNELGTDSTILNPEFKVDTVASRSLAEGKSGQEIYTDARGNPVMAAWSPIKLTESETSATEATQWGVIAKIDVAEALAPVNQLAQAIGIVIGLAVLLISALAVVIATRFSNAFVRPILQLADSASQVTAGNMALQVKVETEDEVGTLSDAFNTMTAQLRDLIGSLEGRVAARTKDLAVVAEISTATATILDINKLLQAVVDLSKERFNYYHSHIYLLDEAGENLVLTAGAGEPGRIMAAEKRSIPLNREQSLVARAAREGKGVIVNDVTLAPDFLPNPLLPNTRAELAVPMIVGGKVIGVFDVQSETIGRFTDADINVKTTLAAQVATSVQNARSFEQARVQAELDSLSNAIGQKIQRATTVEDTLQVAIREVGLALGASRVKVNLQVNRQENGNGNNN